MGSFLAAEQMPTFHELLMTDPSDPEYEMLKIEYLLARLEDSEYAFIQNGEMHSGRQVSIRLKWKLWKNKKHIKTAQDFIYRCASGPN